MAHLLGIENLWVPATQSSLCAMGTATRLPNAPSPFPNSCEVSLGPFCSSWTETAGLGLDSKWASSLLLQLVVFFFFLKPKVKFTTLLRTAGEAVLCPGCGLGFGEVLQASQVTFPCKALGWYSPCWKDLKNVCCLHLFTQIYNFLGLSLGFPSRPFREAVKFFGSARRGQSQGDS